MARRAGLWTTFLTVLVACGDGTAQSATECESDEDCKAGVCVAADSKAEDLAPLPLTCGDEDAEGSAAGEECDAQDGCARGVCLLAGTCAIPCASEDHCAAMERCQDVFARTGPSSLQPVRACVSMVDLPSEAKVMIDVREDALTGKSETDDTLQLPLDILRLPGAEPTTWFVLEHLDDDRWPDSVMCRPPICPLTLRTRDDAPVVLFDRTEIDERCLEDSAPEVFTGPRNAVSDDDHQNPVVVMIKNGTESVLTDAGYEVSVTDEVAGDARLVTITSDTTDDDSAERTLGLNVFWVGMERDESLLEGALDDANAIFEQAAIRIDVTRHVDVGGGLPKTGATFDSPDDPGAGLSDLRSRYGVYAEQPALFRLSAGAGNAAVNLFLIASIESGGKGDPFGKSGGTPAPPGMHGMASSGLVIELDALSGRTLAHEIGHHLGLFHTSEVLDAARRSACVFEPLPDTPECHADRDADGDGNLSCDECGGAGSDNLMFPLPCTDSTLSPQQVDILRAAPVLRRP